MTIVAVGRDRDGTIAALVDLYVRRCVMLAPLIEVESRKAPADPRRRDDEASLLLASVPPQARTVALDERGRQFTSMAFAELLAGWRDQAIREVAFLIGGADGHGAAVIDRADLKMALGTMTWPHLMVRAMLAEQVYRASTILAGHPYHRA